MSCFRLKNYETSPPGGFFYEFNFKGKKVTLGPFPIIDDLARALSNFRSSNGKARSSIQESLADADHFQCLRLGNMPGYCLPCDLDPSVVVMSPNAPLIAPKCRGCGAPLTA